ncbi:MAG: nitroreductase family deazaflavin-dependent oxidoreductase, partial [Aldersonia sp.]|nr:nitroreductase family deazaflavin-dependent oxidoreductase [Aldersonia sp.]
MRRRRRAVVTGSVAAIGLGWCWWLLDPTAPATPVWPATLTVLLVANVPLTLAHPTGKRALVVTFQRWVLNPLVRILFRIGFVPFGYALLETVGRRSGSPRQVPIGNGLDGEVFWVIAEHGTAAGYVRNLVAEPRVRVKYRQGLRFRWRAGTARVLPDDDALHRQRRICRWRPLRSLNAIMVRTLGTEPTTVRIDL